MHCPPKRRLSALMRLTWVVISLVVVSLFIGSAAMWVRSHWAGDTLQSEVISGRGRFTEVERWLAISSDGGLALVRTEQTIGDRFFASRGANIRSWGRY